MGPRGGGTVVITRSHRVVARFAASLPPEARCEPQLAARFWRHDDWLRALRRPGDDLERTTRFMDRDQDIGGIRVRVTELIGQPGDVVLTHPWVLHRSAPNTGSYPRMMMTKNLCRRGTRGKQPDAIGSR